MSFRSAVLSYTVLVALTLCPRVGFAQGPAQGLFKIRNVRQQLVVAPDYRAVTTGAGNRSSSLSKKWLQIETEFDSDPEWADDVTLKYYVLVGKGREARLFGGEVTYINVQKGQRHLSAMFMHPNTVERYGRGRVESVHVEVWYKGQRVDQETTPPTNVRWWEGAEAARGFLLDPQQTPWSVTAFDIYESPKPRQ